MKKMLGGMVALAALPVLSVHAQEYQFDGSAYFYQGDDDVEGLGSADFDGFSLIGELYFAPVDAGVGFPRAP